MLLMVRSRLPVFLSVTFFAALVVPIALSREVRLVGDKVAFGPEIAAAPLNVTLCGVPRNREADVCFRSILRTFSGRTYLRLLRRSRLIFRSRSTFSARDQ